MKKFNILFIYLIALISFLSACSNNIHNIAEKSDPFEKFNRKIFSFNKQLDLNILKPVSEKYISTVPANARQSISEHLDWMSLPNTIINSTLQFDLGNTVLASAKFLLNSLTLGFYDLDNNETNIDKKDFGSTLAKYNVAEGPFLMIPLLGPKNARDVAGLFLERQYSSNVSLNEVNDISLGDVDLFEFPINFVYKREKLSTTLDSVYKSSDPYIKMRSFYVQNRRAKVYNNKYNEVKDKEKDEAFEKLLQ